MLRMILQVIVQIGVCISHRIELSVDLHLMDLKKFLSGRGILIRSCASYRGLDDSFFRVAVKRREENKELLSQMEEWARKNFSSDSEV